MKMTVTKLQSAKDRTIDLHVETTVREVEELRESIRRWRYNRKQGVCNVETDLIRLIELFETMFNSVNDQVTNIDDEEI